MLQILRQAHMWRHQDTKDKKSVTKKAKGVQLVVDSIISSIMSNRTLDQDYNLLHECNGGIRLLMGTGFTLLSTPEIYHILATATKDEEVETGDSWEQERHVEMFEKEGWQRFCNSVLFVLHESSRQRTKDHEQNYQLVKQLVSNKKQIDFCIHAWMFPDNQSQFTRLGLCKGRRTSGLPGFPKMEVHTVSDNPLSNCLLWHIYSSLKSCNVLDYSSHRRQWHN